MPGRTIKCVLAAIATAAAALVVASTATASPTGPCADVPYVGVCVPLTEQPSPSTQQSLGEVMLPDTSSGIHTVN